MKSCGRFCGTSRPAKPTTTRAPSGRSGEIDGPGANDSASTPLCTTSVTGAFTRGPTSRPTASPLQISRSGPVNRVHVESTAACNRVISVLPARQMIGTPHRRAAGVPTTQENEPDANTTSMSRSRMTLAISAMQANQQREYRHSSDNRRRPRGLGHPPGKFRVNT